MTQGELEKIPKELEKIFSDMESRIMEDVVRRIRENGFSTASADWQITKLRQLGMAEEDIRNYIQDALQASEEELERIFSDEVYRQYMGHERAYQVMGQRQVPYEENAPLQQLVSAVQEQISGEYQSLTQSMGFALRRVDGTLMYTPLLDYYRGTLDQAVIDIHSGAFSYQTVLERTVNEMTASGVRWIDYNSGHHNRVDVAARRAVMTGFRQVQGKINEQVARELGTNYYEVSYHVGARPEHQGWQGQVYSMEDLIDICGLGDVTGLLGANCYHDYLPFIPGISVRNYTDEQLEEMMAKENTPKEYYGREYTTYEALQRQRRMETTLRKYRQDIHLLQTGGSEEMAVILKQARYQGKLQDYEEFSRKMGLPMQRERIYQDGLRGRFVPTKEGLKKLENIGKNTTIKRNSKFEIHPDKINKFLLKPGAKHAQEFFDVGYMENDYKRLFEDIEREFDRHLATDVRKNSDGSEDFSIFMDLGVTDKKTFRTVWRKDTPDSKPRLITGHREDR